MLAHHQNFAETVGNLEMGGLRIIRFEDYEIVSTEIPLFWSLFEQEKFWTIVGPLLANCSLVNGTERQTFLTVAQRGKIIDQQLVNAGLIILCYL